ncbi:PhzF family phenazine biosynthesis protein [Arsenicicoccus dermatophilus]|uniref:PhzF family phenazine biosynthesis protein n=1 Tax=Arsenicicoccus dermatophilus TaxID=1076331 RepID=UPI001F4C5E6D|nr:PhzF family phenazine biosynthesis isomerase [Arsenicicoccus dermatophilus]MCH8614259.1 PhzF family phenazine biosynthesis isomerase [Arsenicicoccus dermatophilus]
MPCDYRLLNVFTTPEDLFSGNAVAVFTDASGLDDETMKQTARQLGCECSFITGYDADGNPEVRFFQPEGASGFAGGPSMATAQVLKELNGVPADGVMRLVGQKHPEIQVIDSGDHWTMIGRKATIEEIRTEKRFLAGLVGRKMPAIMDPTVKVTFSRSTIVLQLATAQDVHEARIDARLLHQYAMLLHVEPQVYVWAFREDGEIESRMFYGPQGGVLEVAATASGASRLGEVLAARGERDKAYRVYQGREIERPSMLLMNIDAEGQVSLGGHAKEIATGHMHL